MAGVAAEAQVMRPVGSVGSVLVRRAHRVSPSHPMLCEEHVQGAVMKGIGHQTWDKDGEQGQ